ncbi:hypothetical protein Dimus_013808 [Dionaea muscipula]
MCLEEAGICEYIEEVWEESRYTKPLEITGRFANDATYHEGGKSAIGRDETFSKDLELIYKLYVCPRRTLSLSASLDSQIPELGKPLIHGRDNIYWYYKVHECNGAVDHPSPLRGILLAAKMKVDVIQEVFSSPCRSYIPIKASGNVLDLEDGKLEKDQERVMKSNKVVKLNKALISGLAYCFASSSMILINKAVLSSYNFNAGISLMVYQNFIAVIIVFILARLGVVSAEPLTWKLMKVWLPVNFIFVGMLITSMFSLKYINVAMVTVLKNVTNVITAVGETYLFSKRHDSRVWASLFLMIISAICGGMTDLSFNAIGYTWQIANCFLTASYSVST